MHCESKDICLIVKEWNGKYREYNCVECIIKLVREGIIGRLVPGLYEYYEKTEEDYENTKEDKNENH